PTLPVLCDSGCRLWVGGVVEGSDTLGQQTSTSPELRYQVNPRCFPYLANYRPRCRSRSTPSQPPPQLQPNQTCYPNSQAIEHPPACPKATRVCPQGWS